MTPTLAHFRNPSCRPPLVVRSWWTLHSGTLSASGQWLCREAMATQWEFASEVRGCLSALRYCDCEQNCEDFWRTWCETSDFSNMKIENKIRKRLSCNYLAYFFKVESDWILFLRSQMAGHRADWGSWEPDVQQQRLRLLGFGSVGHPCLFSSLDLCSRLSLTQQWLVWHSTTPQKTKFGKRKRSQLILLLTSRIGIQGLVTVVLMTYLCSRFPCFVFGGDFPLGAIRTWFDWKNFVVFPAEDKGMRQMMKVAQLYVSFESWSICLRSSQMWFVWLHSARLRFSEHGLGHLCLDRFRPGRGFVLYLIHTKYCNKGWPITCVQASAETLYSSIDLQICRVSLSTCLWFFFTMGSLWWIRFQTPGR